MCIRDSLDLIRGSQSRIDSMAAAIQSDEETTRLSPFLWGTRRYVNSLALVIPPVDNAVRTTRVLARRALVLCEDDDRVSTEQIMLIDELSEVCLEISEIYDVDSKRSSQQAAAIPVLVNQLRGIAQRSGMDVLELEAPQTPAPPTSQTPASENAGGGSATLNPPAPAASTPVLSAYAILAQTRSLVVDLLQVCGMSRESALAALAPTSTTPRYQPEQFDL